MTADITVAPSSRAVQAARRAAVTDLSLQLLDRVLTVRIALSLGDHDGALVALERSFHALVALDAAMPPDPPAAPAAGPRQIVPKETAP